VPGIDAGGRVGRGDAVAIDCERVTVMVILGPLLGLGVGGWYIAPGHPS
jgi:hypothetical protein